MALKPSLLNKTSKPRHDDGVMHLGTISRKSYKAASSDPAVRAMVTRALTRFRHVVEASERPD